MTIRVFIGYDPREAVAYHVLSHSILRRASMPVQIAPIMLSQLGGVFTRERHPLQSTDFAFARFLTPYLSNYEGWSIFMDCDMLVLEDMAKLWELRDERYGVMVAKHDHQPEETVKFLGAAQTRYEKKNWSSVMLINNARCRALTPEYVNSASGLELHQFKWLEDEGLIGEIPLEWNYLVGYYPKKTEAEKGAIANLHYTLGGPYFDAYRDCDYAKEWFAEREAMLYVEQK